MDKQTILERLEHLRAVQYDVWKSFCNERDTYIGLRDSQEMTVRALDYTLEAIRRNDII